MAKRQESKHLIKSRKCQRTERCGMICQETEPLDEYVKCTCYTDCEESQIINDGRNQENSKIADYLTKNCKKVHWEYICSQEHLETAEYHTKICKKVHCENISSHFLQSSYEGCESCSNCKPRCRICPLEEVNGRHQEH